VSIVRLLTIKLCLGEKVSIRQKSFIILVLEQTMTVDKIEVINSYFCTKAFRPFLLLVHFNSFCS